MANRWWPDHAKALVSFFFPGGAVDVEMCPSWRDKNLGDSLQRETLFALANISAK
jgi:hypothetical protein